MLFCLFISFYTELDTMGVKLSGCRSCNLFVPGDLR